MTASPVPAGPWGVRAERLMEQALGEARDGDDAIPTVTAALTALRIEAGDLPPDAMDGFPFPGEEQPAAVCVCPPELLARGGFRGCCPEHGPGAR